MKLLLDNNLSFRLALRLRDLYPDSIHIRAVGGREMPDPQIAAYAVANGFVAVTRDWDLLNLALTIYPTLKLIRLTNGNASNAAVEQLLRANRPLIESHFDRANPPPLFLP